MISCSDYRECVCAAQFLGGDAHAAGCPRFYDGTEYAPRCPACGDPLDYCAGHGMSGDPAGFAILTRHDYDDHEACHELCDCRAVEPMTITEALERYDEALDESGPAVVAGLEYMPSRVLREVDPTAYRVGFCDWLDGEGIDSDSLTGEGWPA
jgi:hypothetical protein